jgi:gliding motility-associated lipoprotein GldH
MIRKYIPFIGTIALLTILLSSCDNSVIYREKKEIKSPYWTYADSVRFDFDIKDTSKLYSLELDVIHSDTFPSENCYVRILSKYPNDTLKSDVLSLEFADQNGLWMGKAHGDDYLVPIALQPVAKFKIPGKYSMTFLQNNRIDSLPGIRSMEMYIHILSKK